MFYFIKNSNILFKILAFKNLLQKYDKNWNYLFIYLLYIIFLWLKFKFLTKIFLTKAGKLSKDFKRFFYFETKIKENACLISRVLLSNLKLFIILLS